MRYNKKTTQQNRYISGFRDVRNEPVQRISFINFSTAIQSVKEENFDVGVDKNDWHLTGLSSYNLILP